MSLAVPAVPEDLNFPSSSADVLVRLESVGKCFANGVVALTGVNLDVRQGEFLSLLGPSGCGKSTILRLLSALTTATDGGERIRNSASSFRSRR
jgi:NitT/TauT family transport system ATP-binding protein